MGVPGLSSQLRPYARPFVLKSGTGSGVQQNTKQDSPEPSSDERSSCISSDGFTKNTLAIVDGPSLAYHVYFCCLVANTSATRGLGELPTYAQLGDESISFLDQLVFYGFQIDRIFFDGLLPEAKTPIRFERLHKTLLLRRAYRSLHVDLTRTNFTKQTEPKNTLADSPANSRPSSRLTAIPPLAFLVSAVKEALQCSPNYASLTQTVPGEADVFCEIRSDQVKAGVILTNDSDLILLHPHCHVVFLNDLELRADPPTLKGVYYSPCALSKQLTCPDLIRLGYQLASNPGTSLSQCAASLKKSRPLSDDESFQKFAKSYSLEDRFSATVVPLSTELHCALGRLDPRVSEFVLACLNEPSEDGAKRCMYLPPLVDDPLRASAWQASRPFRSLAYSLLAIGTQGLSTKTIEIDRRGDRIVEDEISTYTIDEANESLYDTAKRFEEVAGDNKSNVSAWRVFALKQLLEMLRDQGSTFPSLDEVQALFSDASLRVSWSVVHLHAQIDGLLYSLRILCQVLNIYLTIRAQDTASGSRSWQALDEPSVERVREMLSNLPSLRDLHTRPGEPFSSQSTTSMLFPQLSLFYAPSPRDSREKSAQGTGHSKKSKKKHAKVSADSVNKASRNGPRSATTNVYSLLEEV